MLVERRFEVGAAVVSEGEPGRSMYIVHAGELAVSRLGNSGRELRMGSLGPGDFFGEMTLIEMQNRSATVVAKCPSLPDKSRLEISTRITKPTSTRMCW